VRRLIAYVVLGVVACTPTVVATRSLTPTPLAAPSSAPTTFLMKADLYLAGVPYEVRGPLTANGDERLAFRLEFQAEMDTASVIAAIRAQLPEAVGFEWLDGDSIVTFEVPPGTTAFTIDPRGARTRAKPNIGVVSDVVWSVSRPRSTISLYRPSDIAAGVLAPAAAYSFDFAADTGLVRLDSDRKLALVSIIAPQHLSFVDLTTGRRTALPSELNQIGTNGAYMHWLNDGRFLTLGTHDTVISGRLGENRRRLPTITPGQSGWVSPDDRYVALESYPTDAVAIQDLATGAIRDVAGDFNRCSAYSSAAVSWSPDGRALAVGFCTGDMEGPARTVFVDADTLRVIRTLDRWAVMAWLPNGTLLAREWPIDEDNYARQPDPRLALLNPRGEVIRRIASPIPYGASPDGLWLVDGGLDPQHASLRLVEIATGRAFPMDLAETYPTWTADGLIAVLSRS
jgi:hypothetical protein